VSQVRVVADVNGLVESAVREAIDNGDEIGLQISVVMAGRLVVDIAAGVADQATGAPVEPDSLVTVFSATKGILAMTALAVAATGEVDLERPVAAVWPEFAVAGKHDLTPIHLLTHTAGIPQVPDGVTIERMCDWDAMSAAIAELEPLWTPGRTMAYHAYTFGWAVGESIRQALGGELTLADIVRTYITEPAGAHDFHIGVPPEEEHRVVKLYREPGEPSRQSALGLRAIPMRLGTVPEVYNRSDVRRACLPAAGGITNARSLAAAYGMLAAGGAVGERQVVPEAWVEKGTRQWRQEIDLLTGLRTARGLGFVVSSAAGDPAPFDESHRTAGHPGAGGSIAWADFDRQAGIAITRNRLTGTGWRGPTVQRLIAAANAAIDATS
jgi:CubicO group peptidase (beta-lactamase class C family)